MHVLFVAYRFPPQSGGGVIRPVKFAKYLSRLGARVTVLTAEPPPGMKRDASLLLDVPSDVRVISVRERSFVRPQVPGNRAGRLRVARRWAIYQCLVPDERVGFIGPAVRTALDLSRDKFTVVLATGGPWSALVAGEKISRTLNVPLVLDYRDPWTTVFSGLPREAGLLARWMNPALERRIVSRASAIVSVHKSVPALMEAGLGIRGLAARCDWIPNGYDPEDFENVTANPSEDFTLTYVGSLYGGRSLRPVAEALGKLVRSGQLDGSRIRFKVLGPDRTLVMKDFAGTPFGDCVDAPGFVSHRDALSALVSSTVNVLVDIAYDGPNVHTPGKLYEYLRAGRPILSVSPEGATREVIDEARAGWVVSPGDRAGLLQVLKKAHDDWRAGRALPAADPGVTNLYDRARLAAELADILRACVRDKVGRQTL